MTGTYSIPERFDMARKIAPPDPPYLGPAKFHGGAQSLKPLKWITIHGTVSPCERGGARSIADYFRHKVTRASSAHYVVDPGEVVQVVGDHQIAFHAPPNGNTIGVEHCDPQVGNPARWHDANHQAMLARSARLVAQLCLAYDLPIRRVGRVGLKLGRRGITGHADVSLAFRQSTHTDPGEGFPWRAYIKAVRAEAKKLQAGAQPNVPTVPIKPVPATPPPKRHRLVIVQANLYKDSRAKAADVALLDRQTAHLIGCNEGSRFVQMLRHMSNYTPIIEGSSSVSQNNPILVRKNAGITIDGSFSRPMCAKVGSSPARSATVVRYTYAGERRAHVQTHTNAHIELGGKPRTLPRVQQDIVHMQNLAKLVAELRAERLRVTVGGDFNWAWTNRAAQWTWSPRSVFKRMGLDVQWSHRTAVKGGSLGKRRVDYVAYDSDDLTITSQRVVSGEHSDHRWPEVTFTT